MIFVIIAGRMTDMAMLTLFSHSFSFSRPHNRPKGVMTSFRAMTESTKGLTDVVKATSKDRYMSYLPVSHGMERWVGEVSRRSCHDFQSSHFFPSFLTVALSFSRLSIKVHSVLYRIATLLCRLVGNIRG